MERVKELEKQNEELRNALQMAFNAMLENYDNEQALNYTDLRDAEQVLDKYQTLDQKIDDAVNKLLATASPSVKAKYTAYGRNSCPIKMVKEQIKIELEDDGQSANPERNVVQAYAIALF